MNIKILPVGELQCNCYLLEQDGEALIIDPGDEYNKIKELIGNSNLRGILLTHSHYDHIGCVNDILRDYRVSLYDNNNLDEGINRISTFNFEVIKTYGHTMDSVTYYFKDSKIMFTGDFLFRNSIGRVDFPESNRDEMKKSIGRIRNYSKDITIYPGHGSISTLDYEFKNNIFFLNSDLI